MQWLKTVIETAGRERQPVNQKKEIKKEIKMVGKKFQNRNTKKMNVLEKIDSVKNSPENITVYIFDDGSRWDAELFYEYWRAV